MTDHNDFMTERDVRLGQALRDYLELSDDAAFTAAVMERIRLEPRETSWEILARWAPVGMAAAALLALVSGLLLGRALRVDPGEPVYAGDNDVMTEWLSSSEPITADFILTAVLTGDERPQGGDRR